MQFFTSAIVILLVFIINKNSLAAENVTTATTSTTTSTTVKTRIIGVPRIAAPIQKDGVIEKIPKTKLVCPDKSTRRPFFALPCRYTKDCSNFGASGLMCCDFRCMKGVKPPKPEPIHSPAFFGLVERVCPLEPMPEFREIKQCESDYDCTPRICCPEKMLTGEIVGYCRTAQPKLDKIPMAKRLAEPIKGFMAYMQCTPPPPPILDAFPKPCKNALDCFPNLCCQERGKKFCRPPERNLFSLIASMAQRLVPSDAARKLIARIT